MNRKTNIFVWIFLPVSLILCAVQNTFGASPYQPKYKDPLSEPWRWIHYKILDGMGARCMTETADGTFWFGTEKGIVRFDGKEWILSSDTLFTNLKVLAMFTSSSGEIWVADSKRLLKYSKSNWEILLNSTDDFFNRQLYHSEFTETADGSIWIGSMYGLIRISGDDALIYSSLSDFPKLSTQFKQWHIQSVRFEGKTGAPDITTLCQVSDSVLWIGKSNGQLFRCRYTDGVIGNWQEAPEGYIPGSNPKLKMHGNQLFMITSSRHSPVMSYDLKKKTWKAHPLNEFFEWDSNENASIATTSDNKVWVGGFGRIFSYDGQSWREYQHPEYPIPASRENFYIDSQGRMWIVGMQNEVRSIDYSGARFQSFDGLNFQFETNNGDSWYLTYEGYVVRHSSNTDQWTAFNRDDGVISFPVRLYLDSGNRIWVIGSHHNVAATGWFEKGKWSYHTHPQLCWSVCETGIMEEENGTIWFGALGNEAGNPCEQQSLVRYFPAGGDPGNPGSWDTVNGPGVVFGIGKDADHTIYTGSYMGLSKYDSGQFVNASQLLGVEYPRVDYIGGKKGELWMAVRGQGVFLKENDSIRHFMVEDGLASNTVTDILFLENDIWFGTDRGISRFQTRLNTWIPTAISGQLVIRRESGNLRKSQSGHIWINQNFREWKKYLYSRIPDNKYKKLFYTIRYIPDTLPPETVIKTEIKRINSGDELFVLWDGMDPWSNTPPEELLFSYQMDHGEWSPFLSQHNQLFSSLKPGKHLFSVRACDGDFNVDPTPVTFAFEVVPPVYRQTWFIGLIGLLVLTILFLFWYLMLSRQRRLKSELALSMAEKENLRKLDEMKFRFFTNISHEIRTPLTLILDPVRTLISRKKFDLQMLQLVEKNTSRLQRIINQLLDFRKIESDHVEYIPAFGDLLQTVNDAFSSFSQMAGKKEINYQINTSGNEFYTWFDADKVEKILANLLSNAIKYTPSGEMVTLHAGIEQNPSGNGHDHICLTVSDTGIGIPKKEQKQIFERYFRAGNSSENPMPGSGIGLSYTRELVMACNGIISFESIPGRGTTFTVVLPVGLSDESTQAIPEAPVIPGEKVSSPVFDPVPPAGKNSLKILIIEDNPDLRIYLKQLLSEEYLISTAENGMTGISEASEKLPDLIISDVMMPEMDGLDFTKRIKSNEQTSHIPVILLTARKSEFQQLEGLKAGADDYITKPFNSDILREKIRNIFFTRDKMIRHFKEKHTVLPVEIARNDKDKEFVKKLVSAFYTHISDSDFKNDELCREIGMSRTLLYAKIKSITGMTLNEFVQTIRLKEAARLIANDNHTITEAMYDVGYNNPGHFRKIFRQQFHVLPSEFKNNPGN